MRIETVCVCANLQHGCDLQGTASAEPVPLFLHVYHYVDELQTETFLTRYLFIVLD